MQLLRLNSPREKKTRCVAIYFTIAVAVGTTTVINAPSLASAESGLNREDPNLNTTLESLGRVLGSAKKPVRLYYFDICNISHPDPLHFPRLTVQRSRNNKQDLDAVRDVFRDQKGVRIMEGRDGIIRVNVQAVSTSLLQTKIPLLSLKPDERYTAELAVIAITSTRQIKAAARRLRLEEPPVVYSISVQQPVKGLSHLPASMRDVTMDEALDAVAKTFRGLVVYRECASPSGTHFFRVDYSPIGSH